MSMSTSIVGIKPADEKWKQMKAARDACIKAGIEIPIEVNEFFDWMTPDENGVLVNLEECSADCVEEYNNEGESGFQVNLSKVPKDVKFLRFTNSW